ncbi:MAG: hypothetical protein AAB403_16000 [Planctomycetota bacterium]
MISYPVNLRQSLTLLAAVGAAVTVAGCGRTLVFIERDGVNLAIRASGSTPPLEVNFGLNRTVATIVPPANEKGDAVSMFAGFQVDNTLVPTKALDADLQIDTQFASGKAATAVAGKPRVVALIVDTEAGAKIATEVDAAIESVIAAISCDDKKTINTDLRNRLITAANAPVLLRSMQTPDDFRKAIRNSPGLVDKLNAAATKLGRPECQK